MKPIRKMGWFRPAYYFLRPLSGFLSVLVFAYLAITKQNEMYPWLCLSAVVTTIIQITTAVREYKAWIFNASLLNVYVDYADGLMKLMYVDDDPELTPVAQIRPVSVHSYESK